MLTYTNTQVGHKWNRLKIIRHNSDNYPESLHAILSLTPETTPIYPYIPQCRSIWPCDALHMECLEKKKHKDLKVQIGPASFPENTEAES